MKSTLFLIAVFFGLVGYIGCAEAGEFEREFFASTSIDMSTDVSLNQEKMSVAQGLCGGKSLFVLKKQGEEVLRALTPCAHGTVTIENEAIEGYMVGAEALKTIGMHFGGSYQRIEQLEGDVNWVVWGGVVIPDLFD